jgi:S-formylglutathione hydrolase
MLGWSKEEVLGKTAHVYEPATRPRFELLYLHGLADDWLVGQDSFSNHLAGHQLACIGLQGGDSWWADRPCPSFDARMSAERSVLDEVLPIFRQRWELAPPSIGLLGTSMGGQGALRLAFKRPDLFPVGAAISAAIEYHELFGQGTPLDDMYDSKEQCRQDTASLHVSPLRYPPHIFFCVDPEDDQWFRGNDRLHEKLAALGIEHECDLTTTGGGHSINYFIRQAEKAVRFLSAGLDHQSRRLL